MGRFLIKTRNYLSAFGNRGMVIHVIAHGENGDVYFTKHLRNADISLALHPSRIRPMERAPLWLTRKWRDMR